MEQNKKAMSRLKKIIIAIAAALLALVLILGITVFAVWHNEIFTVASMKLVRERNDDHLDGAVYTMGLIKMNISDPDIGCSSFTAKSESGDVLFGRNYDFSKTNTCIVFTEKNKGRHASISTVDLQFLGMDVDKNVEGLMNKITCLAASYAPLDGINDAGVSCGIYMT